MIAMESNNVAMVIDDSDDEMLSFRDQEELVTYMQNRLIELGFGREISNAFRNQFSTLEELEGMCIYC